MSRFLVRPAYEAKWIDPSGARQTPTRCRNATGAASPGWLKGNRGRPVPAWVAADHDAAQAGQIRMWDATPMTCRRNASPPWISGRGYADPRSAQPASVEQG